jgi:adenylate kinase
MITYLAKRNELGYHAYPGMQSTARWQTILIVGPTGSGKTPLGQFLEKKGLWETKCLHFDFGAQLRASVVRQNTPLNREEMIIVRATLKENALLEDKHFFIAAKLLNDFLFHTQASRSEYIILNGLPRHQGQADLMEPLVEMKALIELTCTPEVAKERIRTNAGGDRVGRGDDTLREVENKLRIYREKTAPLLSYYKAKGVPLLTVPVEPGTSEREMLACLEGMKLA